MTRFLVMTAGLIAWAVQFTVIYGVTAVACARGYADVAVLGFGVVPLVIVATTAGALGVTAWVLLVALRGHRRTEQAAHPTDQFLTYATILISGLSLITIFWHGVPAFIVPPCW